MLEGQMLLANAFKGRKKTGGRERDRSNGSEVWTALSPGEPLWGMQMRWLQPSLRGVRGLYGNSTLCCK